MDNHGNEVLSLGSFALLPEHVVRLILSREELTADELTKFQVGAETMFVWHISGVLIREKGEKF